MLFLYKSNINTKNYICFVIFFAIFVLSSSSQILIRTNSYIDLSAISSGTDLKNVKYGERVNIEESIYYRNRYSKEGKERTVYTIFTIYKKNSYIGICPYGIDFDLMSEHFQKNKANTFRYWNKIRMGFKMLVEKNLNDRNEKVYDYFIPEAYFSFLHLPHSARGDLTTKARKGSFMFYFMIAPTKRALFCIKQNIGSVWIKPYFKQESIFFNQMENSSGINMEFEISHNGYNHSIVQSSRDIYRGIMLFGGPEYNFSLNRIFLNIGFLITTENH